MSAPVKAGDTIAGKYLVERVLGMGGMGVVVAAKHLQLGERVAIKFLQSQVLGQKDVVARFLREASTAARIHSEYVARVHDQGTLAEGSPYIVMEYLEGKDLGAVLQEQGPMEPKVAIKYVLQACEALAEAHSMGIVHRDLKPANILVIRRRDGLSAIKIIDFGISKLIAPGGSEMTMPSVMMGSPLYMAPEQMSSARDADPRSDVWSLGAILYHLLTGSPPYNGSTAMGVFELITLGPPSLREARPELPEGLDAVIQRCLRRAKEDRYLDVAELAAALVPFGPPHAELSAESASRILRAAQATGAAAPSPISGPLTPAPASPVVRAGADRAHAATEAALPVQGSNRPPAFARTSRPPPKLPTPSEPPLMDVLRGMERAQQDKPRESPTRRDLPIADLDSGDLVLAPETQPTAAPVKAAAPAPPKADPPRPAPLELPPGAGLGERVEQVVEEALTHFGIAGKVMLEKNQIVLHAKGPPTSIDAGLVGEQWPLLPPDMQRRKAADLARRLAEAHRAAGSAMRIPRRTTANDRASIGESMSPAGGLVARVAVGVLVIAAAATGLRFLLKKDPPPPPPVVPTETPAQERARLDATCKAMRERVYSGATVGPFETTGWVVELWLAGRATQGDAGVTFRGVPDEKASRAAVDEALGPMTDGTIAVDETTSPASSPGWKGGTLVLGGGYARAFFEADKRARFHALGDRLVESSGAELGAIYGRCPSVAVHDVGAWFRGRDAGGAAAALLYEIGMFAESPHVSRGALVHIDAPGQIDALRGAATAAKLDAPALKSVVWEQGGSLVASPGSVVLTFPVGGPVRAVRASRAVAAKLGVGTEP